LARGGWALLGLTDALNGMFRVYFESGALEYKYVICRLFIGKNCARGLEYGPRPQFLPIRTDLSRQITCLFFPCGKLVYKWVCLRKWVIELAYVRAVNKQETMI